jgi:hypothetical protein
MRRRFWREGALARINNREELEAWLRRQPREVSVAFAARTALRVLPIIHVAEREGYVGNLLLPLFRAASVSWAIARYSARENELAAAAHDAAVAAQSVALSPRVGFVSRTDSASRATVWTAAFAAALASGVSGVGNPRTLSNALHFASDAVGTTDPIALGAGADAYVISSEERFWSALSSDAALVELGKTGSDIAGLPLSPEGHPHRPRSWQEMKPALLAAKQDWDVWTDWYEARLDGRVNDEERELAYVRIEEALWAQGPAVANAEIKRRIEELEPPNPVVGPTGPIMADIEPPASETNTHFIGRFQPTVLRSFPYNSWDSGAASMGVTEPEPKRRRKKEPKPSPVPEIPPQRPAALEPVWSNGKLVLPPDPASTDGDLGALVAALKVLRAEIAELADDADGEANIDKRSIIYLRRKAEGIPNHAPAQDELFRLAHAKEFLEGYARTVNEEWPDFLTQRFHKLTLHFDRTVRQFPKWRDFVRNAEKDRLTPEQVAGVPGLTNAFVEAMRDEDAREFIDPSIPEALDSLQAPLHANSPSDTDRPPLASEPIKLLPEDVIESINNIAKRAVEAALASDVGAKPGAIAKSVAKKNAGGLGGMAKDMASRYGVEARKSLIKEAKRLGKETGPAITKWVKRAIYGGSITALMQAFPAAFHWLEAIKQFLHLH